MIWTLLILWVCNIAVPTWLWVVGATLFALQVAANVIERHRKRQKVREALEKLDALVYNLRNDEPPPQGRYD